MRSRNRDVSGGHPLRGLRKLLVVLGVGVVCLVSRSMPAWGWEGAFFDWFEGSISARASALGGWHSALADDGSVLFSNPAGLRSVEKQFSVSEFTLSFYESAAEIAGETLAGSTGTGEDRRAIYSLWGPLALSYVGNGQGYGLFSSTNVYLHAWGPIPSAREALEDNLVLIAGRAFRIPLPESWQSTWDIGFTVVGFATTRGVFEQDLREVVQSSATLQDLAASSGVFKRALGAGLELGMLYSFRDLIAVGVTGRNLAAVQTREFATIQEFFDGQASSAAWNVLPMDISVGFLFRPPLRRLEWLLSDLVLLVDYHDIFDFAIYPEGATNPLLHIGVGLEFKLLDIVSLRAGYYQCLPSVGLGLDLTLFKLNLAYFGRELSNEPGGYPVGCYTAGLEFTY